MFSLGLNKKVKLNPYISIFIFFWSIFALTNCGFDYSEGSFHYQVAEHIIKTGQLGFDTEQQGIFSVAPNGRTYASQEIGNTIFFLPTATLNVFLENVLSGSVPESTINLTKEFIFSFHPVLYCAITVTVFFAILRVGLKQPFIASFIATLCLAFTTFLWTYTRETFDGILAMTLLTISFFILLLYKLQKKGWLIPLAFLCLGFSFITRISMVLAIAASLGYLVLISYPSLSNCLKNCAIAILTLIPFIAWQCWYNNLRTGVFYLSPVQTDPKYAVNNALDNNIFVGLAGLLFSPGKSIFIFVPLLILSLFFLRKFFRNFPKEALFISVITVLWFLLHARLRSWYGGGGWGPRYMVTILPLMFLPFAANMKVVLQSMPLKIATLILGVWGLILNGASIIGHWYWRLSYAREDEMSYVWSIGRSQPLDMLKTAIRNLLVSFRLLFVPSSLKGQNLWFIKDGKFDAYGSHTVNVWANSLIFIGVPWYLVAFFVLVLLYLIYFTLQNILRAGLQADAIE